MAEIFDTANIRVEDLNSRCKNTMSDAMGLYFTEIGPNYLKAKMAVSTNTSQPLGMLNGGASMAIVEILGSLAANLVLDRDQFVALGQSITGNHFRPVPIGQQIEAVAKPIHIGKKSQVWEVEIFQAEGKLVCKGSIGMAVVPVPQK